MGPHRAPQGPHCVTLAYGLIVTSDVAGPASVMTCGSAPSRWSSDSRLCFPAFRGLRGSGCTTRPFPPSPPAGRP